MRIVRCDEVQLLLDNSTDVSILMALKSCVLALVIRNS